MPIVASTISHSHRLARGAGAATGRRPGAALLRKSSAEPTDGSGAGMSTTVAVTENFPPAEEETCGLGKLFRRKIPVRVDRYESGCTPPAQGFSLPAMAPPAKPTKKGSSMSVLCLLGRRLSASPAKLSTGRVAFAALMLLSGGCRMCCPAYDYCSPTNPHGDQSWCCDHGRRGSYFSGDAAYYGEQVVGEETVVEGAPQQAPAAPMNENIQDTLPPVPANVNPAPNPAPAPPPVPRGPMTSRGRSTVMMPSSSRRTR
jgi:hypothetical protein